MTETFVCQRCGGEFPLSRLKEVMYERDRERVRRELCPTCLDEAMNSASEVRGIVGDRKAAAVRISGSEGSAGRQPFGERG